MIVDALPLQQHPHFADALRLLGSDVRQLDLPGAAPVQTVTRFGMCFTSRGPIWRTPDPDALRSSELRLINSDGHDAKALRQAGFRRIMTPAVVAELDLTGTKTDRMARLKGKWRNTLRRAQNAHPNIQRQAYNSDQHRWLINADKKQQKAKKFRGLPHSFIDAYAVANPRAAQVFITFEKTDPIAAMLFLQHANVATYHLGWTNELGRRTAAHHAIFMRAATHFAKRNILRMDLGTIDTENATGLARFKIGTGAIARPLGGTWLRIPGC